jgi:O-antigen/teichoic acid export membrane protein
MSLKLIAYKGVFWTFIDTFFSKGLSIISSIILARLLLPEAFGIMGMIYVFTAVAGALIDSGLPASLIRNTNVNDKDYSTIFFANIVFSIVIYLILYFAAPYIAVFYNKELLVNVIRVYSILFVLGSFSAVQVAILTKRMEFKKLMILNIPGVIIGSICGIILANHKYEYWSIIIMQLITQMVFGVLLWKSTNWVPKFYFSFKLFKKHFNFGYKIALISIFSAFFDNIYNIVIGKFYSVSILGQFERARTFNNYPVGILTSILNKVTFPLLSNIQNDKALMLIAYKKIICLTFFIAFPLMSLLSLVSEPLMIFVLGEKWGVTAHFFKILCIAGILYPLNAFNMDLMKVYGRSGWLLKNEIIKKIIMGILILISFPFGVYYMVWSIVLFSIIALYINAYYAERLIKYSLLKQLLDNQKTIFTGLLSYSLSFLSFHFVHFEYLILQITVPFSLGFISFGVINYLINNEAIFLIINLKSLIKIKT